MTPEAEALVLAHLDMVGRVVDRVLVRHRVWLGVDRDDLLSVGRLSLLAAARTFDGRGRFGPFAAQRVRWAVLDEVRRQMPLSRSAHREWKAGTLRHARFYEQLSEVHDGIAATPLPLPDPFARAAVADALMGLPPRYAQVLRLRFWHDIPHRQIAQRLRVTDKRIHQIVHAAQLQLRARLSHLREHTS